MKYCISCKFFKPYKEFYFVNDSYSKWCKSCIDEFNIVMRCTKGDIKLKLDKENKKEVNRKIWARKYYYNNREKIYKINLKWNKSNPKKISMYQRNRRAKINNCDGTITDEDWDELLKDADYKCLCCGTTESLSLDHIIPIALGGENTKDNAQVLCRSCNSKKHTNTTDYRNIKEL